MLCEATGLRQHLQDLGHSFSLQGPPSRQTTYMNTRRDIPYLQATMWEARWPHG